MNVLAGVHRHQRRAVRVAVGVARADHGQLVGVLADAREVIGDHQAALAAGAELAQGRREEAHLAIARVGELLVGRQRLPGVFLQAGLVVERVDLAGPAVHHQEDARSWPAPAKCGGLRRPAGSPRRGSRCAARAARRSRRRPASSTAPGRRSRPPSPRRIRAATGRRETAAAAVVVHWPDRIVPCRASVDIDELVDVQQHMAQRSQRRCAGFVLAVASCRRGTSAKRRRCAARCASACRALAVARLARQGQPPGPLDLRGAVRASFGHDAARPARRSARARTRCSAAPSACGATVETLRWLHGCVVSLKSNVVISGNSSDRLVNM